MAQKPKDARDGKRPPKPKDKAVPAITYLMGHLQYVDDGGETITRYLASDQVAKINRLLGLNSPEEPGK